MFRDALSALARMNELLRSPTSYNVLALFQGASAIISMSSSVGRTSPKLR